MLSNQLISIVVTTYNRSEALVQVVRALTRQKDMGFEVIVADDGSDALHRAVASQTARDSGLTIAHVWHPDVGFTASQVRNLGVVESKGNYIVFLDGDCIPELDFVQRHRQLMEPGFFVNGSRILLSRAMTEATIAANADVCGRNVGFWLRRRWSGDASKLTGLVRLPDFGLRRSSKFKWRGIRSCNMGVWRSDFEKINGFDETFVGWGHEDADFVLRLHNLGLSRKNGFCSTEVYHLWHRESSRSQESVNAQKVRDRMQSGLVFAEIGYKQSQNTFEKVVTRWG
jgi:glycosyltransferase involved in cell wall biosynthesis